MWHTEDDEFAAAAAPHGGYGEAGNGWASHRGGVVSPEPPTSPYGFPVPAEILALRPGEIFSMEVRAPRARGAAAPDAASLKRCSRVAGERPCV